MMIPRNDPSCAGTAPILEEGENKSRESKTAEAVAFAAGGCEFPARRGRARHQGRPMMKKKTHAAAFARGESETAGHPEITRRVIRQLGNGRQRCTALQRFLHGPEDIANARHTE